MHKFFRKLAGVAVGVLVALGTVGAYGERLVVNLVTDAATAWKSACSQQTCLAGARSSSTTAVRRLWTRTAPSAPSRRPSRRATGAGSFRSKVSNPPSALRTAM